MSLQESLNDLKINVFRKYIYFIPEILFDKALLGNEIENHLLNKTHYLDENLFCTILSEDDTLNGYINEDFVQKSIFTKRELFTENIIKLIDLKKSLTKTEFKYLLNNYFEFISVGAKWSETQNQLSNVLLSTVPTSKLINSYKFQLNNFKGHLKELISNFKLEPENHEVDNIKIGLFLLDLHEIGTKINTSSNPKNNDEPEKFIKPNVEGENDESDSKPTLSHYIIHDKRKEIEKIIFDNFKGKKGMTYRCIIEYFLRNRLITLEFGNKRELHKAFQNTFNVNVGLYSAMWGYEVNRSKNKTYGDIRNKLEILLKGVI